MINNFKTAYSQPVVELLAMELVSVLCETSVEVKGYPSPYDEVEL